MLTCHSATDYCVQCLDYVPALNSAQCGSKSVSQPRCQLSTPRLNRTKLGGLQGDDKPRGINIFSIQSHGLRGLCGLWTGVGLGNNPVSG